MGGLRDLFETLSELFVWLLRALRVPFQIIGTLLSDLFGLLVPRLFELFWLFLAYLHLRLSFLGDGPTNLTNVVAAMFSAAFFVTWAILRMTRILSDPERRGI